MSVVFLIQRPVDGFQWLRAYVAIMEFGLEKTVAVGKMVESHSAEMNLRLTAQRVFHKCEPLHQMGVKVSVESYTGSLRKRLRTHINSGDVDFIVTRPGVRSQFMSLLQGTAAVLSLFRQPSPSPFLRPQAYTDSTMHLLHPGA